MDHKWVIFGQGKSIGKAGSEGGKIIRDEENPLGARVTLEDKGDTAPFSITLGIYGITFHTEFFSTINQGQECFELFKEKIEQIINHYSTEKSERDETWSKEFNQMMEELVNIR